MIYLILSIVFVFLLVAYFRIAERYKIVDYPNERSSHTQVTIRGGGIIFLFAAVMAAAMNNEFWLAAAGIIIIGIVSFIDDLKTLSFKIRIVFHFIAVTLLFAYLQLFSTWTILALVLSYIVVIGIINAFNFMDGINGMTGSYSLVVLGGLQYVNIDTIRFMDVAIIWLPMLACTVFLYFNFRKKARCFAGDVGSVTIAFWIVMLIIKLVLITNNWSYILFVSVYGVDTVLTIFQRLWLRQNIFKAHRLHLYQILVNEKRHSHLFVSSIYSFVQLVIIVWVIVNPETFWLNVILSCVPLIAIYLALKLNLRKGKASIAA